MAGLKSLLDNRWVKRFLKFLRNRGKEILERVDLGFLDSLFQRQGKQGRQPVYEPEQNLAIIYWYANGIHHATEMARLMEDGVARAACGYLQRTPINDTLSRFLKKLAGVARAARRHQQQIIEARHFINRKT